MVRSSRRNSSSASRSSASSGGTRAAVGVRRETHATRLKREGRCPRHARRRGRRPRKGSRRLVYRMEPDLRDVCRDSRPRSPPADRDIRRGARRAGPRQGILASGRGNRSDRPVRGEARGPGVPPERLPDLDLRVRGNRHVAIDASGRADGRRRAVPALHAFLRSAAAATREHHRTTRTVARLLGGDQGADSSPDQDLVRDFSRGGATRPRLPSRYRGDGQGGPGRSRPRSPRGGRRENGSRAPRLREVDQVRCAPEVEGQSGHRRGEVPETRPAARARPDRRGNLRRRQEVSSRKQESARPGRERDQAGRLGRGSERDRQVRPSRAIRGGARVCSEGDVGLEGVIRQHDLATIPPNEELTVIETPSYLRHVIPFAAYNAPARFEAHKQGFYMVTPVEEKPEMLREHSYPGVRNTAVHEGYPGHHLQLTCASLNPSYARILADATETVEGWAHYCEDMMKAAGFSADPRTKLVQLLDQIWRACRILIDVDLHTGQMTFDEAVDLLVREAGMEHPGAVAEVKRYTYNPAYQLSYLIGKYLIVELRNDVKKRLGKSYSDKLFHDTILYSGSLPMKYMREIFDHKVKELGRLKKVGL